MNTLPFLSFAVQNSLVGLRLTHQALVKVLEPLAGLDDPAYSGVMRSAEISLKLQQWWSELQRHPGWLAVLTRDATEVERQTECLKPLMQRATKALGKQLNEIAHYHLALGSLITPDGEEPKAITRLSDLRGIVEAIDGSPGAMRIVKTPAGRKALQELSDQSRRILKSGSPDLDSIRMLWTLATNDERAAATLANDITGPAMWQCLRDGLEAFWSRACAELPAAASEIRAGADQVLLISEDGRCVKAKADPRTAPAWKLLHAAHRVNREQNSKAWRYLIDKLETDDLPTDLIETGLREQFAFERSDHGLIRIAHESDGIATAGVQPEQYGYLLYGKTQRELDTLFDSLGADWVNKRVRELQARYPAEAAEMKLAELVQAAPAAEGDKSEAGGEISPVIDLPSDEFRSRARPKSRELFRYLAGCTNMRSSRTRMRDALWNNCIVTSDAPRKGVENLAKDLLRYASRCGWRVEQNKDEVWLVSPKMK